jgi:hypothetical protein
MSMTGKSRVLSPFLSLRHHKFSFLHVFFGQKASVSPRIGLIFIAQAIAWVSPHGGAFSI